MFRDSTSFSSELSPAEQVAFEQLVHAIGFVREAHFGRGNGARLLSNFPAQVVYALTPVTRVGPHTVREYRLFVAGFPVVNGSAPKVLKRAPKKARAVAKRESKKETPAPRGSPEFRAKMSEVGRANWRKRVKKYGPTGVRPGREPWKMPNNLAYRKHQEKLARDQAGEGAPPQAPKHAIKTF